MKGWQPFDEWGTAERGRWEGKRYEMIERRSP